MNDVTDNAKDAARRQYRSWGGVVGGFLAGLAVAMFAYAISMCG